MIKFLTIFTMIVSSNLALASDCSLSEVGAKSMAELYVLKNEDQIRMWVGDNNTIQKIAEGIAATAKYSSERNSYFFDVITLPNNGGPLQSGAWLEASCSGINMDYQLID
tara:strand:- start:18061 stop:18390 length:330 start_codon:yes stop_codon:yes gene_type:complete